MSSVTGKLNYFDTELNNRPLFVVSTDGTVTHEGSVNSAPYFAIDLSTEIGKAMRAQILHCDAMDRAFTITGTGNLVPDCSYYEQCGKVAATV